jgi:molybdate transport system regulatory protein
MSDPTLGSNPRTSPGRSSAPPREPRAKAVKRAGASKDASKLKIQIDFPGGARLGPGKVALLELIDKEGSLSRAADTMGISYRRAWLFMSQINKAFDEPAVSTPEHGQGGGPARLTPFGHEVIRHYRAIEAETAKASSQIMKWLDRHRAAKGQTPADGSADT